MIIPIYTAGKRDAGFDPIPGCRERFLVVPGGSELLETRVNDETSKVLFVPSADPLYSMAWTAWKVVKAARLGASPFRLI